MFPRRLMSRVLLVSLLGSLSTLVHISPSVGAPIVPEPAAEPAVPLTLQSDEDALAEDLALVAAANGWTIEEAGTHRHAADVVGRIAEQVAATRPDIFVGSVLSLQPDGTPELDIKGAADPAVRGLVANAEVNIRIVDSQPFSFDELEERKLQVHRALEAQGFRKVSTGFSITGRGQIRAGVTRQAGLPTDRARILLDLPNSLRASVALTVNDTPIATDEHAFGSMRAHGPTGACTSGWSVYNGAGTTGVTTAGHCTNIHNIDQPGGGTWPLTHQQEHRGQWGDVEWLTSTHIEPAQFYANATEIRWVRELEPRAAIAENEQVCLYGRSSNNRDCTRRVQDVSQACTNDGVFNDRLVLMNGDIGIPGDSGGGWSWANRAYGSHKGNCADVPGREVFSVADLYDEALGVTVRLSDTLPTGVTLALDPGAPVNAFGDQLVSTDGRFQAVMQGDGNFVVYQNGVGAIWASSWCGQTGFGTGYRAVMQGDGNFVMYPPAGGAVWATSFPQTQPGCPSDQQTRFSGGSFLRMQTDGNLVLYSPVYGAVWATNT